MSEPPDRSSHDLQGNIFADWLKGAGFPVVLSYIMLPPFASFLALPRSREQSICPISGGLRTHPERDSLHEGISEDQRK